MGCVVCVFTFVGLMGAPNSCFAAHFDFSWLARWSYAAAWGRRNLTPACQYPHACQSTRMSNGAENKARLGQGGEVGLKMGKMPVYPCQGLS